MSQFKCLICFSVLFGLKHGFLRFFSYTNKKEFLHVQYLFKCLIGILISECAEYNYTGLISHFQLDLFFSFFSKLEILTDR